MRRGVQREPGPDEFFSAGLDVELDCDREVFFLAYHLHWSWTELMDMECDERRAYAQLLVEQIERENARIEAARDRN